MKIIIPNLPIYILHYIAQCLESTKSDQCNILLWNTNRTSIIDMFDETHPDIVYFTTNMSPGRRVFRRSWKGVR